MYETCLVVIVDVIDLQTTCQLILLALTICQSPEHMREQRHT